MSTKATGRFTAPKKEKIKYSKADKRRLILTVSVSLVILLSAIWSLVSYGAAVNLIKPLRSSFIASPSTVGITEFDGISVVTEKGITLDGWYMPASGDISEYGDKVIIISHNYESSRESAENDGLYFFKQLLDEGYDVVTFDYSGSGQSEGKYYTFGTEEKDELLAVTDEVHRINPNAEITLFGWAFGAAAAISAGCESEYVTSIIADSSYADLDSYFKTKLHQWTGLPSFLFDTSVKGMMESISNCDFSDSSPITDIMDTSGKRFFFIHGKNDPVIATSDSEALYSEAVKNNVAQIWIIEGAPHICGFPEQEENYVNRVIDFLDGREAA